MPVETIGEAGKSLIDYGVLGIGIVFLICAVVWLTRRLLQAQDDLLAAKEAHKDDAVKFAGLTEVMKNQMQSQADLMKLTLETLREGRRQ